MRTPWYDCPDHGRVRAMFKYAYCPHCNRLNCKVWRMKGKNAQKNRDRAARWYAENRERKLEYCRQRREALRGQAVAVGGRA